MKKNNYLKGAFIVTLGIFITKIIGMLYVIPFYSIIGEQGGALYGYAYSIYSTFLSISTAGIPMAISKIISEYNTLGYEADKQKAFKLGKQLAIILGLTAFIFLIIFAPSISKLIIGDIKGGNSISQITFVIRVISSAIIIVPVLSIYRGYFQGINIFKPTSISQILEQLVRVLVIIIGSYLTLNIFNLSLTTSVGVAVFGATVGACISYFYLVSRYKKLRNNSNINMDNNETHFSNKEILKKILLYSFPLIMIEFFRTLYNSVDTFTLVKTLVKILDYDIIEAESIIGVLSTWGSKLNMIVTSISTGIIASLVPSLTSSIVSNNKKDIQKIFDQTYIVLLYFVLPMTVGLSILARPIWVLFYGFNEIGILTFSYSIFIALFFCLFASSVSMVQILKYYKELFFSLFFGFLLKLLLNIPMVCLFNKLNLPAQYGAITVSILGYLLSFVICLYILNKKINIDFKCINKHSLNIILSTFIMALFLIILKLFIIDYSIIRVLNIFIILCYVLVGLILYFIFTWRIGTFQYVFGENITNKIKKIVKK